MTHRLRAYRHDAGLSLKDLADKVGVTKSHLSKIETGVAAPSLDLVIRLSAATGGAVSVTDFVSYLERAA